MVVDQAEAAAEVDSALPAVPADSADSAVPADSADSAKPVPAVELEKDLDDAAGAAGLVLLLELHLFAGCTR